MTFSREYPSPRYQQLIGFYRQMHEHGDPAQGIPADKMFDGQSLIAHVVFLRQLLQNVGARTVLDYGSGKAGAYDSMPFRLPGGGSAVGLKKYWDVDRIHLYDPGYGPHSALPDEQFHAVIATDVMEHVPQEDITWVIDELYGYAERLLYACIATYPAKKFFPDGSNVHVTLHEPDWWIQHFDGRKAALNAPAEYVLVFDHGPGSKPDIRSSFLK